jgi:hypothetical protein
MALTAAKSPQGFELVRYTHENELLYVAGDPGDTIARGNQLTVSVGEGVMDLCATTEQPVAIAQKSVVMSSLATPFPKPSAFDPASDSSNSLVPVKPQIAAGVPIYKATFASHYDDVVASYDAATPYIGLTTGCGADDRPNGGFVYVYEGPGAGEVNLIADYDHTGGTVELMIVLHRAFSATLTTDSKLIIVSGEAASSRGIGFFNRIDSADQDNLTAADGANDGDWCVYADWRELESYLRNLTLPVVPALSIYAS